MLAELVRGTESAGDPIRCDTGQQFNCAIYAVVYLRDIDDQAYGYALSHVVDAAE